MYKNPKNILVANHHLNKTGGTETYCYSLIEELQRRGHNVEYFAFKKGDVSSRIENDFGISYMSRKKYHLILANHNTSVNYLFNKGFVIQTCHGIFPELEQPSPNADAYVAISNEVETHLKKAGYDSKIILNGINLERYSSAKAIRKPLQYVLSLCHSEEANDLLRAACEKVGASLLVQDKYNNPVWDVENRINESDLVVGVGRSAYEGMACGRPVIIFDHRQYYPSCGDGYGKGILDESIRNNCSGRFFNRSYSVEQMVAEMKKYQPEDGRYFRTFAETNLDIRKAVDAYLSYFGEVKKNVFFFGLPTLTRRRRHKKCAAEMSRHFDA